MSACKRHPNSAPKYHCSGCTSDWCEDCVQTFQAGEFQTTVCPQCGAQCMPADLKQAKVDPSKIEAEPETPSRLGPEGLKTPIPEAIQKTQTAPRPEKAQESTNTPPQATAPAKPAAPEAEKEKPPARESPELATAEMDLDPITPKGNTEPPKEKPAGGPAGTLLLKGLLLRPGDTLGQADTTGVQTAVLLVITWILAGAVSFTGWSRLSTDSPTLVLAAQLGAYLVLFPLLLAVVGCALGGFRQRLLPVLTGLLLMHGLWTLFLRAALLPGLWLKQAGLTHSIGITLLLLQLVVFSFAVRKALDVNWAGGFLLLLVSWVTTFYVMSLIPGFL